MHLYDRFKDRFGTAGVLIGVIALVLALVTGAYAAGGGLSGKQKKEVKKIAQQYAGKDGAPGAAGTNGTNGTNGKDGANGAKGEKGDKGDTGTPGESVNVSSYSGPECSGEGEEGAKFTNATGTAYACNGAEGAGGGGGGGGLPTTLGSGETETGAWWLKGVGTVENVAPISFPIPLAAADAPNITADVTDADGDATCTGSAKEPTAPTGDLCVYVGASSGTPSNPVVYAPDYETEGVGTGGAFLFKESLTSSQFLGGSFAVTAP